jgi:hypothetical protein
VADHQSQPVVFAQMNKGVIPATLLLASSLYGEKPRTCYWYSANQLLASRSHARLIKVNGQLKMYTNARVSQDGVCRPPSDTNWSDWKLVARDPGDKVEAVEDQPPRVK